MKFESNWTQTYTGKKFVLMNPDPEAVCIEDVAHSLAMQCRFNGHTTHFYSVAEHSWWVSHIVPPEFALQGLMHDASEAYISDIPKPFKVMLGFFVEWIEHKHLSVIGDKFGFDPHLSPVVKDADVEMLLWERDQALRSTEHRWSPYIENYQRYLAAQQGVDVTLQFWSPEQARIKFLERFEELQSRK